MSLQKLQSALDEVAAKELAYQNCVSRFAIELNSASVDLTQARHALEHAEERHQQHLAEELAKESLEDKSIQRNRSLVILSDEEDESEPELDAMLLTFATNLNKKKAAEFDLSQHTVGLDTSELDCSMFLEHDNGIQVANEERRIVPALSVPVAKKVCHATADASRDPIIGDLCCVHFDKVEGFFGMEHHGCWFPGMVVDVVMCNRGSRIRNVLVRYTDHTEEYVNYPSKDFRVAHMSRLESSETLKYRPDPNSGEEVTICQKAPTFLEVGDSILCLFQGGQYIDNPNAFYRGRVAKVYGSVTDSTHYLCDIAYDDGDVETGIPYGADCTHIVLLSRGTEDRTWMTGLETSIFSSRAKKYTACRVLPLVNENRSVELEMVDGVSKWTESHSYQEVAAGICSHAISAAPTTALKWPAKWKPTDIWKS